MMADRGEYDCDIELPGEVAGRLHEFGNRDRTFEDFSDDFGRIYSWERDWLDPETGKVYHTYLRLCVEEVRSDSMPEDKCPECGEPVADDTEDATGKSKLCDVCGWSTSGVRKCIRCGTRDPALLVKGDAVCRKCRA